MDIRILNMTSCYWALAKKYYWDWNMVFVITPSNAGGEDKC